MSRCAACLVALAAFAAYAGAPATAFQYDDFRVVVIDASVHSWRAFADSMPGMRPLTKATYVANWLLSPSPAGFAIAGVAMHVVCALLVFALARRWLAALAPASPRPAFAALVAGLVYALHPAQTEAAVYIAARSTVLSTLATLAALYAWERAREAGAAAPRRAWLAATLACFAAAMAAREAAWTLPLLLVLVEFSRGERFAAALRATAPVWLAFAALAGSVLALERYRNLVGTSLAIRGPLDNLIAQVDAVVYLVAGPLLTLRLDFDAGLPARDAIDATWLVEAAALTALGAFGVVQLRRRRWLGFGIVWFFVALAPTHGVLARYELANDRQLHLALAGPALIAGTWLAGWSRRSAANALAAAVALVLGVATFARVADYSSEIALWEATVRASPSNARAWNNLGYAYQQAGDVECARGAYATALAIDARHRKARGNLAALADSQDAPCSRLAAPHIAPRPSRRYNRSVKWRSPP